MFRCVHVRGRERVDQRVGHDPHGAQLLVRERDLSARITTPNGDTSDCRPLRVLFHLTGKLLISLNLLLLLILVRRLLDVVEGLERLLLGLLLML